MRQFSRILRLIIICLLVMFAFKTKTWADDEQILTYLHHERISAYDLVSEEVTLWSLDVDHNLSLEIDIDGLDPFDYAWSPDGSMVATNDDYPGLNASISVFDMNGNQVVYLYTDRGHFTEPNWLPNSEQLVFVFHHDMEAAIYSIHLDEPDNWQLLLDLPNFLVSELVVSSDGQWMFVTGGMDSIDAYLIEIGDDTLTQFDDIGYGISWSSDGQRILYMRSDESIHTTDLYTLNLEDNTEQRLTDDPNNEFQAAWSPDGTQIAFVSDRDGDDEIFIMNADGTNVRQMTFNDVDDSQPAWMP